MDTTDKQDKTGHEATPDVATGVATPVAPPPLRACAVYLTVPRSALYDDDGEPHRFPWPEPSKDTLFPRPISLDHAYAELRRIAQTGHVAEHARYLEETVRPMQRRSAARIREEMDASLALRPGAGYAAIARAEALLRWSKATEGGE